MDFVLGCELFLFQSFFFNVKLYGSVSMISSSVVNFENKSNLRRNVLFFEILTKLVEMEN